MRRRTWTSLGALRICLPGLMSAALCLVVGCSSSDKDEGATQVSLRLPIPVVDTAFAPYYLAEDEGFFARNGIETKVEPGTPELNPVKMVSQGLDEFGVLGGPELLLTARSKGAPIVAIALVHRNSDFVRVVTLKDSGITALRQLEGKRVGFFYGHISTDILRMAFKKANVSVEEVDVGFDYGPLINGSIDAQWAFRTTAGISLPARGVEINLISPREAGIITHGHVLVTSEQMVQEQPAIVQEFTSAVLEALQYSLEHDEKSVSAAASRDPNFKKEVGREQLKVYNATIRDNVHPGWIGLEDLSRTADQMLESGLLESEIDVSTSYTNRFVRAYYEQKGAIGE